MTHPCPADGCDLPVNRRGFMCRPHWYAVPGDLRGRVADGDVDALREAIEIVGGTDA